MVLPVKAANFQNLSIYYVHAAMYFQMIRTIKGALINNLAAFTTKNAPDTTPKFYRTVYRCFVEPMYEGTCFNLFVEKYKSPN